MEAHIRTRAGLNGINYRQNGTYKKFFFDYFDFRLSVPFRRCLKHIRPSAVDDTKCYVITSSNVTRTSVTHKTKNYDNTIFVKINVFVAAEFNKF
jgi:hypothetical protein